VQTPGAVGEGPADYNAECDDRIFTLPRSHRHDGRQQGSKQQHHENNTPDPCQSADLSTGMLSIWVYAVLPKVPTWTHGSSATGSSGRPIVRPQNNNEITLCFGTQSQAYSCSTARILGVPLKEP
jgi:hypothetical protein